MKIIKGQDCDFQNVSFIKMNLTEPNNIFTEVHWLPKTFPQEVSSTEIFLDTAEFLLYILFLKVF